jgi:hypothetical protein
LADGGFYLFQVNHQAQQAPKMHQVFTNKRRKRNVQSVWLPAAAYAHTLTKSAIAMKQTITRAVLAMST